MTKVILETTNEVHQNTILMILMKTCISMKLNNPIHPFPFLNICEKRVNNVCLFLKTDWEPA